MSFSRLKSAFTLMEVNLAVFIMAGGILTMVALYPLGFRENEQSIEDVAGAALADSVLNPVAAALSSTNVAWSVWKELCSTSASDAYSNPAGGWRAYFDLPDRFERPKRNMTNLASDVAQDLYSKCTSGSSEYDSFSAPGEKDGLRYALVASYGTRYNPSTHAKEPDLQRILLCMRVVNRPGQLLAAPVYYTEVRFQGDPAK